MNRTLLAGPVLCSLLVAAPAAAVPRDSTLTALSALPITEVPATRPGGDVLALMLSGDGGWAGLDRRVAGVLADSGIAVVGFNSRAYLERKRTPEQTAAAAALVLRHYLAVWKRQRIVLVGYSRGADILPFVADRLPADLRQRVALIALFGAARTANFHFHFIDLVRDEQHRGSVPLQPELERLRGTEVLCVYGSREKDTACRDADPTVVEAVALPGGHHFDRDYPELAELVLSRLHSR